MSHDSQDSPSIFRYSVSVNPTENNFDSNSGTANQGQEQSAMLLRVLQQILTTQQRQTELLEEMSKSMQSSQRQWAAELQQWKQANPKLARNCWDAAQMLGQVQADYLQSLTDEVGYNAEDMMSSEFVMNEFVDRFGPRMAHLNSILQVLGQLSAPPTSANHPK